MIDAFGLPLLMVAGLAAVTSIPVIDAEPVGVTRRIAIVSAASEGGGDRARLRYAVADAELMAAALVEVSDTRADDVTLLLDFTIAEIDATLGALPSRVGAARDSGRVEVIFYYSGHSDETGLLVGDGIYPWSALRGRLRETGADLAVVIVDSCASGTLTRKKGGTKAAVAPPLTAGDVTGLIILTSASASEAAQESALLGGSFFTHALVTGLRGAADEDSDFIVTVDEAYSYAYHATLVLTEATRGGPQHATRELELRGTGAIGLADLRRKTSALVLDDHFAGRFAIYDARQRNVAEVTKKKGRASSIAFAPGTYQVFFDAVDGVRKATVTLVPDRSVRASALRFIEVATSDTVTRGVTPTLSPRGRALAENAYRMQAIRLKPGLLGSKRVVQGDTEVPLDGSTFYRVVGREDLFAETQGRAAWQTGLWTAGTILAGVGGAVCLGGVAAVAWGDDERWERSPLQTTGAFLVLPGVCALGTGVCTASASTLIPVDPLSQEDREVLIEEHNATTRRGLGLMAH